MTDSSKVPGGWLGFWLGILVTAALVGAVAVAWPDDEARAVAASQPLTPTTWSFAPAVPEVPQIPVDAQGDPVALFARGLPEAMGELLQASNDPAELQEIAVYSSYVIVTYREGDALRRSQWRGQAVLSEPATGGVLDLADLFALGETDLARVPALVQDAPLHYDQPVAVSHVLIDRFLPFDERVLVRVYVIPKEGSPSDGGYVSYTADGTLVRVCC